jgi:hypothetical protein
MAPLRSTHRSVPASGPGTEDGYHFRLQRTDGSPADPSTYRSSTLTWRQGDKIPLTAERTLRVLDVRDDDADEPPVLVVADVAERASSAELRRF